MTALAVALLAVCAALAGFWWWQSRHGLLVSRSRKRVVVTLKSGDAFAGVLYESDRECVVLREAAVLGPDGPVNVDGEALVLRADIAYLQVP